MNTHTRMTPELQFCLQTLWENNITDGPTFEQYLKSITTTPKQFKLVPVQTDDFFTELATKMRELWPSGKKDGKWEWRDSVKNLSDRLKYVWEKRNLSGYTVDDCLLICRQYLSSFQTNSKYMKTLKYFIVRQKTAEFIDKNGKVHYSYESEFANMLENLSDEERLNNRQAAEIEMMPIDNEGTII